MRELKVFISGVSNEFRASRDQLASDLRARGLTVKVQQDFRQEQESKTTLQKLHNYIRDCNAVICIIGLRSGSIPTVDEAAPYAHILPKGVAEASYTQWEFYFADYYDRRLSLYFAKNRYKRSALSKDDENFPALQRSFVAHIVTTLGLDRDYFSTTDQLCRAVLREDWSHPSETRPITRPWDGWSVGSLFQRVLDERVDHFWGRDWLFAEVRDAVQKFPERRLFAVTGIPGSGKSAIFSNFIDKEYCGPVIAYHCCQRDMPRTVDASAFVRSLAFLLQEELPAYREALEAMPAESEVFDPEEEIKPAELFLGLIAEPLRRISPPGGGGPLWIAIDALDEAEDVGEAPIGAGDGEDPPDTIASVIASQVGRLPGWLRVLTTSRAKVVEKHFTGLFGPDGGDLVYPIAIDDKTYPDDIAACIEGRLKGADRTLPDDAKRTIVERSNGNMLYAKRVLDGVIADRYDLADIHQLPPGLDALYYKELSHRYPPARRGEFDRIARPLLASIIAANEQLTAEHLARVIDLGAIDLQASLGRLSDYLSLPQGKYTIYHKSFEDWLLDRAKSKEFALDHAAGDRYLGAYCWKTYRASHARAERVTDLDDPDWIYLIQFGVGHFVKSGDIDRAVELLRFTKERWDEERAKESSFKDVRPYELIRFVFRELTDCPPEAQEKIDPFDLVPLIKDFYQIEPLGAPIETIVRYHRNKWEQILDELLRQENYVLIYAIAEVLAAVCMEKNAPIAVDEIRAYVHHQKAPYRELGAYTLRHLYGRHPELIQRAGALEELERMGNGESFQGRAALGDLLLNLELQKLFNSRRIKSQRFWEPVWPYNWIDIWDLNAARIFDPEKFSAEPSWPTGTDDGTKEAYANFASTEELRQSLLAAPAVQADSTVYGLVQDFYEMGRNPERIHNARNRVGGSPHMLDLIRLAFSHPLWNVTEEAASELASFIEREPKMISVVEALFDDSCWRVRFGATEAAYQLASGHDIGLFGRAVERFYNDKKNPRLRALCAENLVAYICHRPKRSRSPLLNRFREPIAYWLYEDDDIWVLEHMFRLFKTLERDDFGFNGEVFFTKGVPDLLQALPKPLPYSGWKDLSREEFLISLERRRRQDKPITLSA